MAAQLLLTAAHVPFMASRKNTDQDLKALLDGVGSAAAALAPPDRGRQGGADRGTPSAAPWLASSVTLLVLRTRTAATFACEQAQGRGYPATQYERYAIVEAPWLFVSALAARLGLGAEVLGIHLDSAPPALPTLRLLG